MKAVSEMIRKGINPQARRNRMPGLLLVLGCMFILLVSSGHAQDGLIRLRRVFEVESGKDYIVDIDIDAGEVSIEPNDRDDEISVSLVFSEDFFRQEIEFDEKERSLFLSFEKDNWIKGESDHLEAKVSILLPASGIFDLAGRIKAGEVTISLGDLSVKKFDMRTWAGEVQVRFDRPNRVKMRSFRLNTKIGETRIRRLGNARFQYADINNGIGAVEVDFRGDLLNDASAELDLDIGETDIVISEDWALKLSVNKFLFLSQINIPANLKKSGRYYYSKDFANATKKFELKVRPGIGELNIRYR